MPRQEMALRWRQEAPPEFEFSLKASQIITHPVTSPTYRKAGLEIKPGKEGQYGFFRPSDEVFRAWEETARFALVLNARAIVFQCPPNFHESDENIEHMSGLVGACILAFLKLNGGKGRTASGSEEALREISGKIKC